MSSLSTEAHSSFLFLHRKEMVKSASARASKKASEKRRLQRRKSEGLSFRGVPGIKGGGGDGGPKNPVRKHINRCLAAARVDDAIQALAACAHDPHPWVDAELCSKILLALSMNCRGDAATIVAEYMRARNLRVQLNDWTTILQGASQLWPVGSALGFVNTVEPLVLFPDVAAERYFCRFSRLVLQEFLTDAGAAVERIRTQSATSLAAQRLSLLGLAVQGHQAGGAVALVSPTGQDLYQLNKAVLWKGDSVLISPYGASGSGYGYGYGGGSGAGRAAGWPTGPPPPPDWRSPGGAYGDARGGGYGGGGADYASSGTPASGGFAPLEAEVLTLLPVLTVRLMSGGSEQIDVAALLGGCGMVRVDKLAPRTTTARQVRDPEKHLDCLSPYRYFRRSSMPFSRSPRRAASTLTRPCVQVREGWPLPRIPWSDWPNPPCPALPIITVMLNAGEGPEAAARCAAFAAQSGSQFPLHAPHAIALASGIPGLNTSQRNAIIAGLTRRLTLVQVREG